LQKLQGGLDRARASVAPRGGGLFCKSDAGTGEIA
jgi:hypothetical protein